MEAAAIQLQEATSLDEISIKNPTELSDVTLSKNQAKKLKRAQRFEETKAQWRKSQREKRKLKKAAKLESKNLSSLDAQEKEDITLRPLPKQLQRPKNHTIVIDASWNHLMSVQVKL